ncbi:unnamed protein product [Ambrosiozyma monospora]|uniref:Unnamed protein product n=1 Tax=Ambrosiozyma monospora TaxID=43982 RepID=A0A9W7DH42_AMBMO|nr:unnamed protein product [Ambrosiozyma monospora]
MTPTSTSKNNGFAYGQFNGNMNMNGHMMNGLGHRRYNSYSCGSTTSGYGGSNVFNNGSGYNYDNSPVTYGTDEKTMNTLSLINKSRVRWGLTEAQQRGSSSSRGMIGEFPFSGAAGSGFSEPPVMNKDGLDLLLKRVQENNKRIDALISVSKEFVEKEEYLKLKMEYGALKKKHETLRSEYKVEIQSAQKVADGYVQLIHDHNIVLSQVDKSQQKIDDLLDEIQRLTSKNEDLKQDIKGKENDYRMLKATLKDAKDEINLVKRNSIGLGMESANFNSTQYNVMKEDYRQKSKDYDELLKINQQLEEQLRQLQNSNGNGTVTPNIPMPKPMSMSKSGSSSGVLGRSKSRRTSSSLRIDTSTKTRSGSSLVTPEDTRRFKHRPSIVNSPLDSKGISPRTVSAGNGSGNENVFKYLPTTARSQYASNVWGPESETSGDETDGTGVIDQMTDLLKQYPDKYESVSISHPKIRKG